MAPIWFRGPRNHSRRSLVTPVPNNPNDDVQAPGVNLGEPIGDGLPLDGAAVPG